MRRSRILTPILAAALAASALPAATAAENPVEQLTHGSFVNPEPDHWDFIWGAANQMLIAGSGIEIGAMAHELSAQSSLDDIARWTVEGSVETAVLGSAGTENHTIARVLTFLAGTAAVLGLIAGIAGAMAAQQR